MKKFIIYNKNGQILRTGTCQNDTFHLQNQKDEFVMEGIANDVTQKIIKGKVIDKTLEEIEAEKPSEIPFEKSIVCITNEQWQAVQDRISNLEKSLN